MSTIRITTLTILLILLAALPNQPANADAPHATEQFSCTSVAEIPQSECEALVALYNGTNGLNWTDNTGWLVTPQPCSWFGVTCVDNHIQALILVRNRLSGPISPELGDLSNLETLDLSINFFDGQIPSELGDLSKLTNLNLSGSQLSGPIPAKLENLSNLIFLHLPANRLDGQIPVELGNLSNLVSLELYANQLDGPIPSELSKLSNLEWLYLTSNQLSGPIPPELGGLANLEYLLLNDNLLSDQIPSELENLSNLKSLQLHENQLSGPLPSELGNLSNLETLWLYTNLLDGPIPLNYTSLTGLNTFKYDETQLCEPEDPSFETWLAGINDLARTNKPCASFCANITEIPQLECEALLALYDNNNGLGWDTNTGWLVTNTPCSWHGVSCQDGHVTFLQLSGRTNNPFGLTGDIPSEIGDLSELNQLNLEHNEITSLPSTIGDLDKLTRLIVRDNQLTTLPDEIGDLASLQMLRLNENQLTEVPATIGDLTTLTELLMSQNELVSVPDTIGNLVNLDMLTIYRNELESVPDMFANLTKLRRLYLDENHLEKVPDNIWTLPLIQNLGLGGNKLSEIPTAVENLTRLTQLYLNDNQLGTLPTEIMDLTNLLSNQFNIGYNRLQIDDNALADFLTGKDNNWTTTQTVAPTNLSAEAQSSSAVKVGWTPIVYTDHGGYYEVSYATSTAGPYTVANTVDKLASEYEITGLEADTTYSIRIRTYTPAHDIQQNDLWSDYSEIVSATTNPDEPEFGEIEGIKWHDENGNGIQDPDEPTLRAWVIEAETISGSITHITLTDEEGIYRFDNLLPDTYIVREKIKESWVQTYPLSETHRVELGPSQIITGINFGNQQQSGANVYLTPIAGTISVSDRYTIELRIDDIANLYANDIAITFDPAVVQIVDADPVQSGVQLYHGDFFAQDVVLQNSVNNTAGTIQYSTSFQGDKEGIDGSGILAYIVVEGAAPGTTPFSITRVLLSDPASQQIAATQQGAEATVEAEKRYRLKGRIILERRGSSNNAGAEVCVETTCFTMGDDGTYTLDDLPKSGTVTVSRASYLGSAYAYDGEGGGRMSRSAKGVAQEEITLPDVTLLGGDINQDDIIDIKDAVQAGAARNSTEGDPNWDALADITDDGNVNLLDMVAVQANWNQSAPTPWGGTISEGPGGEPAGLSISDENATTEVAVSPADAAINEPNGSIEVDITVADVTDLYGFTTVLTFDPNKVQVVDANENEGGVQIEVGDLLDTNNQFVLVNDVDNQTGTIELSITQVAPAQPQSGSGTIGTITFQAIGAGQTALELASVQLSNSSQVIPARLVNGTLQLSGGGAIQVYLPLIAR